MSIVRRLTRQAVRAAQAEYVRWFGYTVIVHWEGSRYVHTACTLRGAYEWLRCYGTDADVFVYDFLDSPSIAGRPACA